MGQQYITIEETNEVGVIALSKSVFEMITDITVSEVENVEKAQGNKFFQPIQCIIDKNELAISISVRVKYGANVNRECETLQHRIHQNILQMTNFDCKKININVNGFEIER